VRNIRVTFRAVFEQPIGVLNPMGVTLPGAFPVEVYRKGDNWEAREIASAKRRRYEKLRNCPTLEIAQTTVEQSFARCVQTWQIWGTPPGPDSQERMLTPYDVCDMGKGEFGWCTDEDRTHIIHAPTIPPGARIPPAACGARVKADCFISTRANVAPTCKACAEVWEKEYREK